MTDIAFNDRTDMALNLVDLERYPIADLDRGKGAAFLLRCQQQMDAIGWCSFDGFVRPDAIAALSAEAKGLLPNAETLTAKRTIHQEAVDPTLPDDDPGSRAYVHRALQLANDQIPASTLIQRLYRSERLTEFIRRVQRKAELYRCADAFQALNIVALEPGMQHAWHYDTTECTVTLLLQAAERGGLFTFLPHSRSEAGEDREAVCRFLAGDRSQAESLSLDAGTLTLFRGGYALHGVTRVEGGQPRVTAVLTYDQQPDRVISDEINVRIYGQRAARILEDRNRNPALTKPRKEEHS